MIQYVYTQCATNGTREEPAEPAQAWWNLIRTGGLAFEDECCLIELDRVDETGEQRWHALGSVSPRAGTVVVLLVVHAYKENFDGEETIRIISARWAGKNELRRYKEQAVD
jgi:uncharacterized DUF497 family protein